MKLTSPETVKTTGPIVVKVEIRALGFSGFPLPIVLYLCVGKSAREESVSLRANEFLRDQVQSFKMNGTIRREGKLYRVILFLPLFDYMYSVWEFNTN